MERQDCWSRSRPGYHAEAGLCGMRCDHRRLALDGERRCTMRYGFHPKEVRTICDNTRLGGEAGSARQRAETAQVLSTTLVPVADIRRTLPEAPGCRWGVYRDGERYFPGAADYVRWFSWLDEGQRYRRVCYTGSHIAAVTLSHMWNLDARDARARREIHRATETRASAPRRGH